MSYHSETFEDRIVRLLSPQLRDPARTRELLSRLTAEQREQPQPRNHAPELKQASLFESS